MRVLVSRLVRVHMSHHPHAHTSHHVTSYARMYYDDAMMQAEAQGWADAFNKRRPPKEVQFLTGAAPLLHPLSAPPARFTFYCGFTLVALHHV